MSTKDVMFIVVTEVIFITLAHAVKVDFYGSDRKKRVSQRWLKKLEKKKKSAKKTSPPIKAPTTAPITAKCGTYSLGIVSLWESSDACKDNCMEKSPYIMSFYNVCNDGSKMKFCNKDIFEVSFYEYLNCTGTEYVANLTKSTQCVADPADPDSPYWNWKCVYNI